MKNEKFILHLSNLFIMCFGVFGAVFCFASSFRLNINTALTIIIGIIFCIFFTAISSLEKRKKTLLIILSFVSAGVLILCFLTYITAQIRITFNCAASLYANYLFYTSPPPLPADAIETLGGDEVTGLILIFAFLFSAYLSWSFLKLRSCILSFLGVLVFLGPCLFVSDILPSWLPLMTVLMFLSLILIGSKARKADPVSGAKICLGFIPVILAVTLSVSFISPGTDYTRPSYLNKMRKHLLLHNFRDSEKDQSGAISFGKLDKVEHTGKIMLNVRAFHETGYYLKKISGGRYTGHGWDSLPQEKYNEFPDNMREQLAYINGINNSFYQEIEKHTIYIENKAEASEMIFAPYFPVQPDDGTQTALYDIGIINTGKSKEYAVTAYKPKLYKSKNQLSIIFDKYEEFVNANYLDVPESQRNFLYGFMQENGGITHKSNPIILYDVMPEDVPEDVDIIHDSNSDTTTQENDGIINMPGGNIIHDSYSDATTQENGGIIYFNSESYSESDSELYSESDYDAAVQTVRSLLSETASYSKTPGPVPEGRDWIEYFLTENKKGFCVHFATAGALMLRVLGVPARYAEGYVVNSGNFDNGVASIPDYQAHAWVEIFDPFLGWIPVEMTPGAGTDVPLSESIFASGGNETSSPNTPSEPPQSQTGEVSTPESSDSSDSDTENLSYTSKFQPLIFIACFAGFIMLCFFVAVTYRQAVKFIRNRRFSRQGNNRKALEMYLYINQLLLPGETLNPDIKELFYKARFSRHELTDTEIRKIENYLIGLRSEISDTNSGIKKAILYIKGVI